MSVGSPSGKGSSRMDGATEAGRRYGTWYSLGMGIPEETGLGRPRSRAGHVG